MPRAVSTLSWSAALETYVVVSPPSPEARALVPESPTWLAWLAEQSSFAFHGQSGSFTARLEAMQRGERYWYAYLRTGQKVRKKYLGKTADLTVARLEQVARLLQAERAGAVFPDTALPPRKAHHAPARTPLVVASLPAPHTLDRPVPVVEDYPAAAPALPAQPLLSTKLYVPRPPARLVPRSRLIERLRQGLSQTLILLCAPAGFGKTTLVAELLADCGVPAIWLSLDAEDNDPQRFLSALLAAFQTRDPAIGASVQALLSSPHGLQGLSLSAVFTQLAGDLASRSSGDFLLVLDDYHTITLEPLQHAIASLVDHCPPHLHLVITSRADPRLPLARLRARGQLCELRATDLQFDLAEAGSFLHTALERDLEPSTITTILSRTEGWIAGLQLTALLLQGQRTEAEVQRVLADALGTHRYLVEYLGEEVFSRQPEGVQTFLLHTCMLERFSAPLCAAVSGESEDESQALLSALEQANLFLVPLDAGGQWYRYHPLWASVLRVLLAQKLGAEGLAALYGRASRWYEQHDLPTEAIEAAIGAGEFERAVQLVEQLSPLLLDRSQYYTLRRWIEQLPREQWAVRPIVCLAYAWALFLSGASGAYVAPLQEAEKLFRGAQSRIGMGMVETLRALAALLWMDDREALRASQQALALVPDSDLRSRSLSTSILGGSHFLLGELELAWQRLVEARRLHEQSGSLPGLLVNMNLQANVLAAQGRLHEAAERYQQVIEAAAERRENAIDASIRQAGILYEWNAFERAEAHLAGILDESETLVASTFFARGALSLVYLVQARIRQARGEDEAVVALLRQAVTQARQRQHRRFLAQAQAAQVRFWLAHGQEEAVTRWCEAWVRTDDGVPSYGNEPGALTLARVLIARGEPEQALRRLSGFRALARTQGRLSSELEILVLCALAEDAQGQTAQAIQLLQQALGLAEPEGYVRLFVDEGVPMLGLLRQVASRWKGRRGSGYVRQLLTILQAEHPEQAGPLATLPVPLSQRERLILRQLAVGHSISEMAAALVVSPNTLKTQLSSLYRKLNVHSREEALAEALRLHLL
jgi:LuxR family transcriptional regulator, maltose regulon positive regulatory protein